MKTPTNRITRYFSHELEPVDLQELQAAILREQTRQADSWQTAYQRGTSDGYACGWVHAAAVFLGLAIAAAVWRSL